MVNIIEYQNLKSEGVLHQMVEHAANCDGSEMKWSNIIKKMTEKGEYFP